MSERLTKTEVTEQLERFNNFMKSVDMVKLGRRYYYMMANDAKDGRYTSYVYLLRVLSICAKVSGTCYHPDTCKEGVRSKVYRELLHDAGVIAMTDWFNANWEAYKEITEKMERCVKANVDTLFCSGSSCYTPKQILWHLQNLTKFGREFLADYIEDKKALSQGK
jgi:hypothetical protein